MKGKLFRVIGWGLVLLGILLLVIGMLLLFIPASYQATARIHIDPLNFNTQPSTNNAIAFDPYWIESQFEILQSKSVLYRVITNLNLNGKWADKFRDKLYLRTEATYALLRQRIEVRQYRSTWLFEVQVQSEDPNEAASIANEIAAVYRDSRLELRRQSLRDQTLGEFNRKLMEMLQEEVENRGPSPVEIIGRAEPPLRPRYPKDSLALSALLGSVATIILAIVVLRKQTSPG